MWKDEAVSMNIILGKPETYAEDLLTKLSKTDLALIFLKHGGDRDKIIKFRYGKTYLEDTAQGNLFALSGRDPKIRFTDWEKKSGYRNESIECDHFKSWTRPQIITWIKELI